MMSLEREECHCGHDKATHHADQKVLPSGTGTEVVTIYGRCLATWCLCAVYLRAGCIDATGPRRA